MPEERISYRFRVQDGDRVRMPNGRAGTVTRHEVRWGHFLFVWVKPDRSTRPFLRRIPSVTRLFVEERVDALVPIGRAP